MSSKPKQTAQQKELERISIEREKQLRVENARQTTAAFSDNIAFRQKLRGIFSLLSGNFKGFPGLGVGGGSQGGGGGAGSAAGIGGGGTRRPDFSGGSRGGSNTRPPPKGKRG